MDLMTRLFGTGRALRSWSMSNLVANSAIILTGGGMKDFPMSGTITLDFSWLSVMKGFLFGVAVSSVCTIFPSMKSAFVEPVEALRR